MAQQLCPPPLLIPNISPPLKNEKSQFLLLKKSVSTVRKITVSTVKKKKITISTVLLFTTVRWGKTNQGVVGGMSYPQQDWGVNEAQKGFKTSQNHKSIRKDREVVQGRAEPGINCAQAWLCMPEAGKE